MQWPIFACEDMPLGRSWLVWIGPSEVIALSCPNRARAPGR